MFLSRNNTVYTLIFIICFAGSSSAIKINYTNKTQVSVLFIVVDDLRHLGGKSINLPNIQNLAASGVSFDNVYSQQALCAPSRNSMLTGRRPDSLRLYDFYSYWRNAVANFTTMPQFFKERGYKTYSVGKVFHPGKSSNYTDDYPISWSVKPFHARTEKYKNAAVCKDAKASNNTKLKMNLICPVNVNAQPEKTLPDLEILGRAQQILKNKSENQPIFLAVGFHKPHIPLKYPEEFLDKVPLSKVRPPKFPNISSSMPLVAWHPWTDIKAREDIKRLNISFPFGIMPKRWTRLIKQSYFAAALYIDSLIGKLLENVDMKSTIIVLTSDHGWSLGENGLWAKYSNFDVALRIPLIISGPNIKPRTVHTPVELVDIFPTLAHIIGEHNIPTCKGNKDKTNLCFEGKNLLNLHENDENYFSISQYPRPSVYPQYNSDKPKLKDIKIMGYSIRTKRFRYTEWVSFNHTTFQRDWNKNYGIELYDHTIDSKESNNLYLNGTYKPILNILSSMLRSKVEL